MAKRNEFLHNIALASRETRQGQIGVSANLSTAAKILEFKRQAFMQVQAWDTSNKERQKLYLDFRNAQVNLKNAVLEYDVAQLENLLTASLSFDIHLDIQSLKIVAEIPQYIPPNIGSLPQKPDPLNYVPAEPTGLTKMLPSVKEKYRREYAIAREKYMQDAETYKQHMLLLKAKVDVAKDAYKQHVNEIRAQAEAHNSLVSQFEKEFQQGQIQAIIDYFMFILDASLYPNKFPQHIKLAFVPESQQVVVEYDLPPFDIVPEIGTHKYVKTKDEFTNTVRPASQRKSLYSSVIAQITIRTIHELFNADRIGYLNSVVFNGYVDAIDRGTGRQLRECLVTVRVTRDTFLNFDLKHVDPISCLKVMNAGVSKTPEELEPVRPVLEFSMVDHRFIEETDVLSSLDQRPNLMELSPTEFEALISNLFKEMGLETRLTQASRDGGVDCVAYDPRPILGGKVVIQAKRYKHTVGVSAVRDLFGTLQNEGASKGILVTTSGFGKSSFEFASGKPIELISGSNLLYLLEQHAGVKAKIVPPEDWKDAQPDSGTEEAV